MIDLNDLIKPLTRDEIRATIYSLLNTLGFPVASWAKGAWYRTIISVFAKVASTFTEFQALVTRSGFLDYCEGPWLILLAEQVYGYIATPASYAVGNLTLNNTAGGSFAANAGDFRVYNPTTKAIYRNRIAFTLAPNQMGKVIEIEALEPGSASSSAGGTITAVETVWNGVEVTNAAAVVGFDAESPESIRLNCRLSLGAMSPNGPIDAYSYVARTFALNGGVVVNRTRRLIENDLGQSTLLVAGPSGAISAPDVAKIQDAVNRLCTPLGYDCTIASATNRVVNISATVYAYSTEGLDPAIVQPKSEANLIKWVQTIPIGGDEPLTPQPGKIYVNAIENQVMGLNEGQPSPFFTVVVQVPSTNLDLDPTHVPVPGTITVVLQVVNPSTVVT